ncbi:unnamed protein product [Rangifer tarandus platyrhynchus]|uniref:Uncharacterized protein n=2 Tax=Rangifer tarandus platyrhynchus TaxID=3082113 RepID=A0ABN8ZNJ6_RANTA|nr:unnamed protein product [Rangifer tarandus platyrhynchus]
MFFPKVHLQNEMPVTHAQPQGRPGVLSSGQSREDSMTLGSLRGVSPTGPQGAALIHQRVRPVAPHLRHWWPSSCHQPLHTPVLSEAFPTSPGKWQFDSSCFPTWVLSYLPPSLLSAHDCVWSTPAIFHSPMLKADWLQPSFKSLFKVNFLWTEMFPNHMYKAGLIHEIHTPV